MTDRMTRALLVFDRLAGLDLGAVNAAIEQLADEPQRRSLRRIERTVLAGEATR